MKTNASQLLKTLMPAKVIQSHLHKRIYTHFADKLGLVYFGFVDQRSDEHRLVRGLTISATHRDNHYCIGSFQGYDIALVERTDTLTFPHRPAKQHQWIIMTFDLHAASDLPHIFLGLHTHGETFYAQLFTKFSHLAKVPFGALTGYDSTFIDRYNIYAPPAKILDTELLIDKEVAKIIAQHFGSLTIELVDNCLYLYAEHQRPTEALLERMAKYGVWLAAAIDEKATRI